MLLTDLAHDMTYVHQGQKVKEHAEKKIVSAVSQVFSSTLYVCGKTYFYNFPVDKYSTLSSK